MFAYTNIWLILDSYAVASYCTLYITKIDKFVTSQLHSIS
jgi:hypothetical protein